MRGVVMRNIKDVGKGELERFVAEAGFQSFHASQVLSWVYGKNAASFEAMSNVPLKLRSALARAFRLFDLDVEQVLVSADGTKKLLFRLPDDERIEGVIIAAPARMTACVSSQAGCRFACAFCASGAGGFKRNLSVSEMLDEVLLLRREASGGALTHVVFMGTGEPFDNYDNVISAIRTINDPAGLGIGARRITVSTSGVVPGIERFAGEGLQVELSVSLHAADDALRSRLMPINRKYPLRELIAACRAYAGATRRQVTFEYVMLRGVNSDLQSAAKLVTLVRGFEAKVNLIPYNASGDSGFAPPEKELVREFAARVKRGGVPVTVRASRGADIVAACGQLRLTGKAREKADEQKT